MDTNLLVHAHRSDSSFHARAADQIRALSEGLAVWAIPWPVVHEFLAVVTHPRIYRTPTPITRACDQVEAWLASPSVRLLSELPDTHWTQLRALLQAGAITGPRVHDARVATLCLAHGVTTLLTADRDFSRFPTLATRNPLV